MQQIRIGLIGTGWMGSSHANAFLNARMLFGPGDGQPVFQSVADVQPETAKAAAEKLGFGSWTTDWMSIIRDPGIDLVDIATPNVFHYEIAKAALEAGKHVYCEKPLCIRPGQSAELAALAKEKGVVNYVGFNNTCNPANQYVRELVAEGRLGRIMRVTATYDQDALLDPGLPITWRHINRLAGCGTLGDMCTHILSVLQMIMGDMKRVCAVKRTIIPERPATKGSSEMQKVENEDMVMFLAEYENGALAQLGSSRVATGRKNLFTYEIQGTNGTAYYNLERMGEVQVYFRGEGRARDEGFRTVLLNPEHKGYGVFQPQAGISIAFNDMKILEVNTLMRAITKNEPYLCDFAFGAKIDNIVNAVISSADARQWVDIK